LQRVVGRGRPGDPSADIMAAIEQADNWETLENRVAGLRALSRKRQQEVMERLEPLAQRIESILAQAREAKVKIVRQNLLRQAEGYMQELEAEDEPAKIHAANCQMLTNIIKQVQRARAMSERGIDAEAVDLITTHLEEIVVTHETALEAAQELEAAGRIETPAEVSVASLQKRLSSVYDLGETEAAPQESAQPDKSVQDLEKKLYE
jgi:hypothetical protein